ncbi:LPP20 family lipoprotein [Chromatiaceae bacterium AAb-1]|nr:LPP20 family lipoprotein [Chromatiaceae bacterium AAb-1]
MNRQWYIAALFLLLLSSCSQVFDRHIEYEAVTPEGFPVLHAVGYAPITLQPGETPDHKMLMAMRASRLDAYRELTEMVYGQRIDAQDNLRAMVSTNDQLAASVQGVIRGARVIKTYAVDDIYVTELELDFKEVYHIYQNVQPRQRIRSVKYY